MSPRTRELEYLESYLQEKSDRQLHQLAFSATRREQLSSIGVLYHLKETETRKIYKKRGHRSLFEYMTGELGFCAQSAWERIVVMKRMFPGFEKTDEKPKWEQLPLFLVNSKSEH